MRIDVHAHLWFDDYLDLVERHGSASAAQTNRSSGASASEADLARRFAQMDAAGIDRQILSVPPSAPHFEHAGHAVEAARLANDQYADLVKRYPERFMAFAAVPLPHVPEAIAEVDRALDELGMVGVAITTSILGKGLDEPYLVPFFEALDRRGAVLYIHPTGNDACSCLIKGHKLTWMIGAPLEDTIALGHLITAGIPSRFPNIRIIASHAGGALPMLLTRMDHQCGWEAPDTPEAPSKAARRMWYDTVTHDNAIALRAAVEAFGADRLLLGSDFPYQEGEWLKRAVDFVSDTLEAHDAKAVLEGNAKKLFGF